MHHSLLRHHAQKEIFKRNMCRKDIERTPSNKLTKLISSDMKRYCSKYFSLPVTLQKSKNRY